MSTLRATAKLCRLSRCGLFTPGFTDENGTLPTTRSYPCTSGRDDDPRSHRSNRDSTTLRPVNNPATRTEIGSMSTASKVTARGA